MYKYTNVQPNTHPFIHHYIRTYMLYNIHPVIAKKQWSRKTTLYSDNQKTLE